MSADEITVTLTYTEEEAREVARAFLYFTSNVSATHEDHDRMTLIRSAIKAALPRPKPDEPQGLGAVVEDADGIKWLRICGHAGCNSWRRYNDALNDIDKSADARKHWPEVDAVRVLSEGVVQP